MFQTGPGIGRVDTNQFALFGILFLPVRLKLYLTPGAGNRESAVLEATRVALCHKEGVFYVGQETYWLCPPLHRRLLMGL